MQAEIGGGHSSSLLELDRLFVVGMRVSFKWWVLILCYVLFAPSILSQYFSQIII